MQARKIKFYVFAAFSHPLIHVMRKDNGFAYKVIRSALKHHQV